MKNILLHWNMNPLVFLFIVALILIYIYISQTSKGKVFFFCLGILIFLIATSSPLHYLAMEYYFSAHMVAHVLILLLSGPLIVASLPRPLHHLKTPSFTRISKLFYNHPWIAWLTGVSIMWIWHVPAIYALAHTEMNLSFSFIPVIQSSSLLAAGMIFSWPIFGPMQKFRLHPLSGVVYLFTACISCSLLGLLIAFAPANMYSPAMKNISMIAKKDNPWNLTPATDQQAAGLIMWVPCCLVYLSGCFILLSQWFSEKKINDRGQSNYSIN